MSEVRTKAPDFSKFAARRRAEAPPAGELVRQRALREGSALPLVVEPALDDVDLVEWAQANREEVRRLLLRHGGILFRGFGMDDPARFEQFAQSLCDSALFDDNGEHPRQSVTGKVYRPVFYPPEQFLLWHNENSFNHEWPIKLWFGCVQPAARGGETPIVDSRLVYARVPETIREKFERLGVMYMRNYGDGLGLDWQTVFRTEDPAEVEEQCRRAGVRFEWKAGGRLRTKCVRPGVIDHPLTGETVWFNQAQHWHVSCLDPQTRASVESVFDEPDWPRQCYYGDGSSIPDEEMAAVLEVYAQLEEVFPWERGDVLMLDNLLAAHARRPYEGTRRLLVAMGEMKSY
jgi:alpha-ketoglutarate-dependent taurine dioxygenase